MRGYYLPHVKESGFKNPGNFCLWNPESGKIWHMESGIRLKESGIPLTIKIQNPRSTDKYWNTVPWNPESTAWNPVMDSLTWGEY